MQKIVVGVDGSEGSQRALQWAIEEAGRRDADPSRPSTPGSPA